MNYEFFRLTISDNRFFKEKRTSIMNKSDLIIDLVSMREHGEFHSRALLENMGIKHGKSITMAAYQSDVFLDCIYRLEDLPVYVKPFRFDSERFWG